ncbi:MAG TPA: hypothetical protein VG147_02105 [Solirubrobacteraceae bacterium]|jgi:hypothetical protein|nr:hypothetical protein [Solirubrobacteraceae bacterium]
MTDTFANGPSTPGGAAPDAAPQAGDVTGTLAELERKLRELESELSSIGRRREVAGATPDPIEASPPSADQRLVDEALEPPAPVTSITPSDPVAAPVAPQAPFAPPGSVAPQAPTAPAPGAPAPASVAAGAGQPMKFMRPPEPARPRASREPADRSEPYGESEPQWAAAQQERPRPSEAQLASLAELRRFRDRLERFARDLAAEYDALLGRVMSGLTSTATPAAAGPALVEDLPAAAQPTAEEIPAAPESPEDVLFEGRVELGVGPFYDIASLSAFERGLASLPYVVEASVRRFEASHAVVDVRLAAPVALVRELRRTVESGFSVREVADGRVLLTFDES